MRGAHFCFGNGTIIPPCPVSRFRDYDEVSGEKRFWRTLNVPAKMKKKKNGNTKCWTCWETRGGEQKNIKVIVGGSIFLSICRYTLPFHKWTRPIDTCKIARAYTHAKKTEIYLTTHSHVVDGLWFVRKRTRCQIAAKTFGSTEYVWPGPSAPINLNPSNNTTKARTHASTQPHRSTHKNSCASQPS